MVVAESSSVENHLIQRHMTKLILSALLICLVVSHTVATDQEDVAADSVAAVFLQARQAAHLSKLERMGRNTFREKVCKQDMRFASGLINDVVYESCTLTQPNDWQYGQIVARLLLALESASACWPLILLGHRNIPYL